MDSWYGFQFPSNGKAYTKREQVATIRKHATVSIPFKRESIYKVPKNLRGEICNRSVSIPFKRESIYKGFIKMDLKNRADSLFQFPSNGKAYTKALTANSTHSDIRKQVSIPFKRESIYKVAIALALTLAFTMSFNSLQTGKHIQSKSMDLIHMEAVGFNSLQTGKHIQRRSDTWKFDV